MVNHTFRHDVANRVARIEACVRILKDDLNLSVVFEQVLAVFFVEPVDECRPSIEMPVILYLHGNSSSRLEGLRNLQLLLNLNINLFVIDFPAEKRAFYHMRDENGILQGYDLIWRGVEITTGAQREHRYEEIVKNAKEKGLGEDVKFYLDFFKHGCPPHGGFAIGVDRLTMLLLGIPNLKETEFLFRGPNRLAP